MQSTTPKPIVSPTTAKPTLSADMFQKYSDFIYKISGIRFAESKSYFLASKLWNRVTSNNMTTFEEYFQYIQTPLAATKEHGLLTDEITINETFFFRNEPQIEKFEKDILKPMLAKRRQEGKMKIRIWSCASSTGDEAYTTALQLKDMPEAQGFTIEIIGTDICSDAVRKAKEGVYMKYAIRNVPPNMLQRYFTVDEAAQKWTLSQDIKNMVRFQECNLMDSNRIRMLGRFDIAFCRNVLIYFDAESKEVALKNISSALQDDGFLLAGHSENLYSQRHIFKQNLSYGQAMTYQKTPKI